MNSNTSNRKQVDYVDERMARYLKTCRIKRLLDVHNEVQDELRESKQAIQTFIHKSYGKLVSMYSSIDLLGTSSELCLTSKHHSSLNNAISTFQCTTENFFKDSQDMLVQCRNFQKKEKLIDFLLQLATFPEELLKNVHEKKYLNVLKEYLYYRKFLIFATQCHSCFLPIYNKAEKVYKLAINLVYLSLHEKDSSIKHKEASLVEIFQDLQSLTEGFRLLIEAESFTVDDLFSKWSCSLIDLLNELFHTNGLKVLKSHVLFKDVLASFCTSLLPDFCKAVEAAETLFPSCDNVKEIQKMTTFDGIKLILNILLEKALQEDLQEDILNLASTQLYSVLHLFNPSQPILQATNDFVQNLIIFYVRNSFNKTWISGFSDHIFPLFKKAHSLSFTLGHINTTLQPSALQLSELLVNIETASDNFLNKFTNVLQEWSQLLKQFFPTTLESCGRLYYEIEHNLDSLFIPLRYVIDTLFFYPSASCVKRGLPKQTSDISIQKFSLVCALEHFLTLTPLPAYEPFIGLTLGQLFLCCKKKFKKTIRDSYLCCFGTSGAQVLCLAEECVDRMSQEVLEEVCQRWGRALTYFFKRSTQPYYSSTNEFEDKDRVSLFPKQCVYEAVRVTHILRYFFDNRDYHNTSLIYKTFGILDSQRHISKVTSDGSKNVLGEDFLNVQSLLVNQDTVFSPIHKSLKSSNMYIAFVSYTLFQGILQCLRLLFLYQCSSKVAKYIQLSIILLRDVLQFISVNDSEKNTLTLPDHPCFTTLINTTCIFVSSDMLAEKCLLYLLTQCSCDQPNTSVVLAGKELDNDLLPFIEQAILLSSSFHN